jgi:tripartite-type tricarboxylate transporter receptor subunit TctC
MPLPRKNPVSHDLAKSFATATGIFACLVPLAAVSSEYPAKPIRIIVQFTAGTSSDVLARFVAQKISQDWNQQVVVDNRPGAGAVLGTEMGAKAPPDGYTLTMIVASAFGINPTLYAKLPYDAIKDFAPVSILALTPQTLVVSPSTSYKTVKEFVAAAKDKPGQIGYASLGNGSTSHLTMEMFRSAADITLNHVPFKGSVEALTQVIGGQVPAIFDAIPSTLPHIKSGRLRALGITSLKRSQLLPDVPTIAESGYAGFEAVGWIGIAAPAKTPAAILDKLNAEVVSIVNQPDAKERLATLAFIPVGDTREHSAAFIKSEIVKWGKAVKESGARVD